MTDYAIFYNATTGAYIGNYSGADGTAAQQVVPDGAVMMQVPMVVWAAPANLDALRTYKQNEIDAQAEAERLKYITAGYGQAMTYMAKNAEALGYLANNAYPTPFLTAEAAATGTTVAALALVVRDAAIAWQAAGAQIEALRMGAKAAIAAATDFVEIAAAATVDWAGE
jgi:hypothetical protein